MRLARPIFRLVSIFAWIVKSVLLLIAPAVLVYWPMSQGQRLTNARQWLVERNGTP